MEKEYYEILHDHPYFRGYFTKEKLISLIDLKEKEGWRYVGDKTLLKTGTFGIGLGKSDFILDKIVAILEREKSN